MILQLTLIALVFQAAPVNRPAAEKASVSGIVLNVVTGEPIANARVSLARFGVSLGPFAQMIAGQSTAVETTIPAEFFVGASEQLAEARDTGDPDAGTRAAAFAALPLSELHEIIIGPTGTSVVLKSTPPTITDEQGRFAFNDVDPGTYKMVFAAEGFAKVNYGQQTLGGEGIPLTLVSGERKSDIVMRLGLVGAINGHIRDISGQPLAAVPIQLFRFVYDASGNKRIQRIAFTRSDDRGEYRMFYLSPGRYYLSAGSTPGQRPMDLAAGYSPQNRPSPNYALTYYPSVVDENLAAAIEVQPGADLTGIDLFIGAQQSYRVRGRVVDPTSAQHPQSVGLSMNLQISDANISATSSVGAGPRGSPNYKAAEGTFELPNITPGTYTLTASLPAASTNSIETSAAAFRAMTEAARARPRASTTVKVVNADVDGIVLTLGISGSIPGRILLDLAATNSQVPLEYVRVQLRRLNAGPVLNMDSEPDPRSTKPDGSFVIENVLPDEYRISVLGLPAGFYVKEARFGNADLLNGRLRVSGTESSILELLLSPNTGTIDGTASPGAQVVLIPNRNRERTELFRTVMADSAGRFSIPDVAPGDYILAAWEALEPYAFFDPDVIEQAETSGQRVQVSESSSQTVSVTPSGSR